MLGLNPGPFTLRRLLAMAEYRIQYDWIHTAHILSALTGEKIAKCMPPGIRQAIPKAKPAPVDEGRRAWLKNVFPGDKK